MLCFLSENAFPESIVSLVKKTIKLELFFSSIEFLVQPYLIKKVKFANKSVSDQHLDAIIEYKKFQTPEHVLFWKFLKISFYILVNLHDRRREKKNHNSWNSVLTGLSRVSPSSRYRLPHEPITAGVCEIDISPRPFVHL